MHFTRCIFFLSTNAAFIPKSDKTQIDGSPFIKEYSLKLGHKRLSIVGLNQYGNQPMNSSSGRYEIIYNGEIYNHYFLRKKIEEKNGNIIWKGTCDTETLVELFEYFELKSILEMIEGMFAL